MIMSLERAIQLVLGDARQNDYNDHLSDDEVLANVRDTVALRTVVGDEDDDLANAYRVYLAHHVSPTREELLHMLRSLSTSTVWRPTVVEEVWLDRLDDGTLR